MSALQRLTAEPSLLALHLAILPQHSDWQAVDAEVLASARDKLAASGDPALLTRAEVTALLFDPPFLEGWPPGTVSPKPPASARSRSHGSVCRPRRIPAKTEIQATAASPALDPAFAGVTAWDADLRNRKLGATPRPRAIADDRQEADRQLAQLVRPVRCVGVEEQANRRAA